MPFPALAIPPLAADIAPTPTATAARDAAISNRLRLVILATPSANNLKPFPAFSAALPTSLITPAIEFKTELKPVLIAVTTCDIASANVDINGVATFKAAPTAARPAAATISPAPRAIAPTAATNAPAPATNNPAPKTTSPTPAIKAPAPIANRAPPTANIPTDALTPYSAIVGSC